MRLTRRWLRRDHRETADIACGTAAATPRKRRSRRSRRHRATQRPSTAAAGARTLGDRSPRRRGMTTVAPSDAGRRLRHAHLRRRSSHHRRSSDAADSFVPFDVSRAGDPIVGTSSEHPGSVQIRAAAAGPYRSAMVTSRIGGTEPGSRWRPTGRWREGSTSMRRSRTACVRARSGSLRSISSANEGTPEECGERGP